MEEGKTYQSARQTEKRLQMYLEVVEAGLHGLSVHHVLVVALSQLYGEIDLSIKHTVLVGEPLWAVTTHRILGNQHLLRRAGMCLHLLYVSRQGRSTFTHSICEYKRRSPPSAISKTKLASSSVSPASARASRVPAGRPMADLRPPVADLYHLPSAENLSMASVSDRKLPVLLDICGRRFSQRGGPGRTHPPWLS